MKIAVAALHLALLLTLGAWAEATEIPAPTTWLYTYTGSPFAVVTGVYQAGDRITGSFAVSSINTVDPPNGCCTTILSYSFTDGHQTFTEGNSTASFLLGEHNQVQWDIVLSTPTGFLRTVDGTDRADIAFVGPGLDPAHRGLNSDGTLDFVIDGVRFNTFAPAGTWTAQAVPEPTTLMLLSAGLAALAVRRYAGREYLPRFQWWAEEGSNL